MTVHTSPTGFKRGGDTNSDLKDDQSGEDDSSTCSINESSTSGYDRSLLEEFERFRSFLFSV